MNIEILEREFKKEHLELKQIDFCFLLAIKKNHPQMWKQFKEFIDAIEKKGKEIGLK